MGKKTIVCVGAGFLLLGLGGTYNAILSFNAPPVEKSDFETKGVITNVYADVLEHRLTGVEFSAHYQLDYEFVADNGKKYFDTETISEAVAKNLSEGQEVTVQYHSNNPNINATKEYGFYLPVDSFPEHSPMFRLMVCLGFLGMGGLLLFSTFRDKKSNEPEESFEEKTREIESLQSPPTQPFQDLSAGPEELEKMERYREAYLAHRD